MALKVKTTAPKRGSVSRAFGTSTRENHDASRFYGTRLYATLPAPGAAPADTAEQAVPPEAMNRIFCASSERMKALPDECIHLMVTSPPYNAAKEYDKDLSLDEYLALLGRVFRETYRVLAPGGRACVNVANLGRKPYIPLHLYITELMLQIGFLMRGEIIWGKGSSAGTSTAWGSWRSASNPTLRDVHEYILVFSKGSFSRQRNGRESSIGKQDFLDFTKSVWTFPAASARRAGHPAPFPPELPRRLVELYSFTGDVVLDPFCGSGTTGEASVLAGRNFVGYEIDAAYAKAARMRLEQALVARPAAVGTSPGRNGSPLKSRKGPAAGKGERRTT